MSTPASLAFKGQVTEHTTVKWPIGLVLVVQNSTENRSNKQFDVWSKRSEVKILSRSLKTQ